VGRFEGAEAMIARWRWSRREVGERNNSWGYVFIAPALGLYLVFNVWPIIRGFLMAFTDFRFIYPDTRWDFNGLANYREMAHDDDFWNAIRVSLGYTAYVLPTTMLIALLLAVVISKVRHLASFYRWMVYLPVILPVAVTYLMFGEIFSFRFGFINTVLRELGMKRPPNWLNDPDLVLRSLAITDIWRGIGFPTLLFLVGIYSIGSDIYEAAAVDGASGWQQLKSITIPLLKPVFALVLLLDLATIPMVTDPMLILTGGGPQNRSTSLGLYAYKNAFQLGDLRLGYAAAMNLVLGLSCAVAALIVFRLLRSDMESGRPDRSRRRRPSAATFDA
jgi:multiple sugar transport system permease protein